MNKITEVWVEVPGTDGRYMVSNKGHLKQVAKRQRRGRQTVTVFTNKIIPIVSDYVSGRLGWYVNYDNEKHFFDCQSLLALFEGIPAGINNDEIVAAIKKRQETFIDKEEYSNGQQIKSVLPPVQRMARNEMAPERAPWETGGELVRVRDLRRQTSRTPVSH